MAEILIYCAGHNHAVIYNMNTGEVTDNSLSADGLVDDVILDEDGNPIEEEDPAAEDEEYEQKLEMGLVGPLVE